MASTDTIAKLRPIEGTPENSGNPTGGEYGLINVGLVKGIGYNQLTDSGATWVTRLPASAGLVTGATATLMVADDINNPSVGKVAVFAITYKLLTSATDVIDWSTAGTETTVSITMPSTAGVIKTGAIAVVVANMDSVAASAWVAIRIRRLGTNSADTHRGRVVLLEVDIRDT